MLISPLAKKLCLARGIDPSRLQGSGPRGRIMAADVVEPLPARQNAGRGCTRHASRLLHPTRAEKDGYYVYDDEVDMRALSTISLPIAVQCEKLLENRYSLFDYIVRAVVRACTNAPEWQPGKVNTLLFERQGEKIAAIPDSAQKTIYRIARETQADLPVPPDFHPHIVVCDAHTTRAQVAEKLSSRHRPDFALVIRGNSPKVGIRAGKKDIASYSLPYTFYASTKSTIPQEVANRIAADLHDYLYNPVRLLLIS